jgi:hypothetical protein
VDFSDALRAVKEGNAVTRRFWAELDGKVAASMELAHPVLPDGRQVAPMLVCRRSNGITGPFAGGQMDLLADDWEIAEA